MDVNGVIYKLVSMTNDCLTTTSSIKGISFPQHNLDEFTYNISGFPSSITEVQFRDQVLMINDNPEVAFSRNDTNEWYLTFSRKPKSGTIKVLIWSDNYGIRITSTFDNYKMIKYESDYGNYLNSVKYNELTLKITYIVKGSNSYNPQETGIMENNIIY